MQLFENDVKKMCSHFLENNEKKKKTEVGLVKGLVDQQHGKSYPSSEVLKAKYCFGEL